MIEQRLLKAFPFPLSPLLSSHKSLLLLKTCCVFLSFSCIYSHSFPSGDLSFTGQQIPIPQHTHARTHTHDAQRTSSMILGEPNIASFALSKKP